MPKSIMEQLRSVAKKATVKPMPKGKGRPAGKPSGMKMHGKMGGKKC